MPVFAAGLFTIAQRDGWPHVLNIYSEILFTNKKEISADKCHSMDQPWTCTTKTQKDSYCMIPLVWNIWNKQNYRETRLEVTKDWE